MVKILREKTDLKVAHTGGYHRLAVWRPCGVMLHTALQNKSVVCSSSCVTNSTVMKLHESDNRDGITVNTCTKSACSRTYYWFAGLSLRSMWANLSLVATLVHTSFSSFFNYFCIDLQGSHSFGQCWWQPFLVHTTFDWVDLSGSPVSYLYCHCISWFTPLLIEFTYQIV